MSTARRALGTGPRPVDSAPAAGERLLPVQRVDVDHDQEHVLEDPRPSRGGRRPLGTRAAEGRGAAAR